MASLAQRSARSLKRKLNVTHSRTLVTESPPNQKLVTPSDWLEFQANRAQYKTLIEVMNQYGSTQKRENAWKLRDSFRKPVPNATMSALLASGAHFGHSSSKMNPNFMPYAYGERAGITVIDMDQTLPLLRRAANLIRSVANNGGTIVYIGTRPDLRPIVEAATNRMGAQAYHVGERWLPGTLTNRMKLYNEETNNTTDIIPDLVVLLNPLANMTAIYECAKLHVPTVGIIDSNVDPRIVMYPIPANDENTRTAELITGVLSIAGREGVEMANERKAQMAAKRKESDRQYKEERRERYRRESSEVSEADN